MAVTARSRIQALLDNNKQVVGTFVTSVDPIVSSIIGQVGFTYTILDMEHGFMSLETAHRHILAARAEDMLSIVRVRENSATRVQAALDIGADGVIAPKISTASDAETLASATRYRAGGRGACQGTFAAGFQFAGWEENVVTTNANVLTIPLIETCAGVENADAIAAVDGIDVLFFGPVDFAQDYGCHYTDPIVTDAWRKVREAAHNHGKWALAAMLTSEGADILVDDMDLVLLKTAYKGVLTRHRDHESR